VPVGKLASPMRCAKRSHHLAPCLGHGPRCSQIAVRAQFRATAACRKKIVLF